MSARHCTTHHECDCIAAHRIEMGAEIQRLRGAGMRMKQLFDELKDMGLELPTEAITAMDRCHEDLAAYVTQQERQLTEKGDK